jgi:hypothetical protein
MQVIVICHIKMTKTLVTLVSWRSIAILLSEVICNLFRSRKQAVLDVKIPLCRKMFGSGLWYGSSVAEFAYETEKGS